MPDTLIAGFVASAAFALVFAMKLDPDGPIATWAFRIVLTVSVVGLAWFWLMAR